MNSPKLKAGAFALLIALLSANLVALLLKGDDAIQFVPQAQAGGVVAVGSAVYTCSEDGRTLYCWQRAGTGANEPAMEPKTYVAR